MSGNNVNIRLDPPCLERFHIKLNRDWEFRREADVNSSDTGCLWSTVNLPHYGRLEAYDVSKHFQGLCYYRKLINPTPEMHGRKVIIEFEAGMQCARVRVNGFLRETHEGGYLPFFVDITEEMTLNIAALVEVELDNQDNPDVPPGKPLAGLDFCYFSGLYRNVWLHITPLIHVTNASLVQKIASGGMFVRYENVTAEAADVIVLVDVANERNSAESVRVRATICSDIGRPATYATSEESSLPAGESRQYTVKLSVPKPSLWSPDSPNLYTVFAEVMVNGKLADQAAERIGIRTISTDPVKGFFLNGNPIRPFGANRHQAYPYIGNALSDSAQYRDAGKLKAAGFDIIRLSHYPQSTAFLDACDEMGLMVIVGIPGWQHFSDTPEFRGNVVQDIRQTIRRDRNHPSAVLWETSLNETFGFDDVLVKLIQTAHEEYPGDQMLTCGDTEGHDPNHISYDVPYSGWDGETKTRPNIAGKMSLHREYGDNQFGGYSRYSRGDGEALMLVQAWNYQTALNEQLALDYTWGQCTWEAYDNNRGMSPEIATCGIMDPFRLPKFLYYFFESQRKPFGDSSFNLTAPTIYIANYWQTVGAASLPLVIYSNCDEVEVIINQRSRGRRRPDNGPDTPFGDLSGFDLNYWKQGDSIPRDQRNTDVVSPILTGGNCRNLSRPPFTFHDVPFEHGDITAIGYIKGVKAAEFRRRTPGPSHAVAIAVDYSGVPFYADGADTVFVYASVVDESGVINPSAVDDVHFEVEGDAELIGDNPRPAEAGISAILLRAGTTPGIIRLTAGAVGLIANELRIEQNPTN